MVPRVVDAWEYGDAVSAITFPVASSDPTRGTMFRNGYDFKGWYYLDENGDAVYVSNAAGTGTAGMTWMPSLTWQQAHKNAEGAVHLYAGWTPKTYALRFNLNRIGVTSDVWLPNNTTPANTNKMTHTDDVYYYEVEYEGSITPYFDDANAAAVPAYKAYDFL